MSNPLLATFIPEARDLIQISAAGLLKLEKQPDNSDAVNEVFRAVHTLKGSSGLFEAVALTRLVHAAEDLLGAIRSASLELDSDLVDKLLDSLDLASTWIDHLERHEKMPPDAEALSSGLLRELRLYATADVAPASHAPKANDAVDRSAPDWLAGIGEGDRLAAFSVLASGAKVIGLFYRPAEGCFFNGDDPLNLIRQIPELIAVGISERAPRAPLAEIDPYLCNIDIGVLSAAPLDEIDHLFRYMPEQMETLTIEPEWLVGLAGVPGEPEPIGDFSTEAEHLLETEDFDGLRKSASRLYDLADRTSVLASALRWLIAVLNQPQPDCAILGGLLDAAASGVYSGPRRPTRVQPAETGVEKPAPEPSGGAEHHLGPTPHSRLVGCLVRSGSPPWPRLLAIYARRWTFQSPGANWRALSQPPGGETCRICGRRSNGSIFTSKAKLRQSPTCKFLLRKLRLPARRLLTAFPKPPRKFAL